MTLALAIEPHDTLVVTLRNGPAETILSVRNSAAGMTSLERAAADAAETGYGECFWPSVEGGQYWWIFKRTHDTVDVVVLWTRGGVAIWEHVFRATDQFSWFHDQLTAAIAPLR
jgi:hypothetical protein